MVKHIVFWKLKDFKGEKLRENAIKKLSGFPSILKNEIKEIQEIEFGVNYNASDPHFDIVLLCTFNNKEDVEKYLYHKLHIDLNKKIKKISTDRVYVDYEF